MFDADALPQYQEQAIFIQEQIKKCLKTIQKNLRAIDNLDKQTEKDILQEMNFVLEKKTDCLKKELEYVKRCLYEIKNKE